MGAGPPFFPAHASVVFLFFLKKVFNKECAAKAENPEMESVGSYLPNGAATLAAGGEIFGEVVDAIKGVRSPFGKFQKNFPDKILTNKIRLG
jgi:hypothetical protein